MNKIDIFQIQHRPNSNKPYIVKWRVNGRDKSRAFFTKKEAEKIKRKLERAKEDNLDFSPDTGEPIEWAAGDMTFVDCVSEMTKIKSKKWAEASNESYADAIGLSIFFLVRERHRNLANRRIRLKVARDFIVNYKGTPRNMTEEEAAELAILKRYSLPLKEIKGKVLEDNLQFISTLENGKQTKPRTYFRRKQALHQTLEYAYKKEYIKENPLDRTIFEREKIADEIPPDRVLSKGECRKVTKKIATMGSSRSSDLPKMASVFMSIMWLAGLRPGEVAALRKSHIRLGKHNEIKVEKSVTSIRPTSSALGKNYAINRAKARKEGQFRLVPINTELLKILVPYLDKFSDEDFIFPEPIKNNSSEVSERRPIPTDTIASYFEKARPSKDVSMYDLRHTYASILIAAGYNVVEVAERLGNSPAITMKFYAHIFREQEGHDTSKEDVFLAKASSIDYEYSETPPWGLPSKVQSPKPALKKAAKKTPQKTKTKR
jgi:integrase